MHLSIFTPTHNPKFLLETYHSIKKQNYNEWIIFINGGISPFDIQEEIRIDSRTKIVTANLGDKYKNVGAIKNAACMACSGEIIVELDHDDLMTNDAIEEIRKAFENPNVVYAYSNCAEFNHNDNSPRVYGEGRGWEYRDFIYNNILYKEILTPVDHPSNSSIIYFSPNHVRCWRKSTYQKVGGHDPNLQVLDDQDLTSKLYLEGDFYHIKKCLYLYRVHGDNTWLEKNQMIQNNATNSRNIYFPRMAEAWAKKNKLKMIDLGGRFSCPFGYESVDCKDADIVCDLNGKYPFEDNSVGIVRAADFLEHIADKMHSLSEIHRILIPGGILLSSTPSTTGPNGEAGMGADQRSHSY